MSALSVCGERSPCTNVAMSSSFQRSRYRSIAAPSAGRPDPSVYRAVSAMLAESGLDHVEAKAGCARCQACSGLSAWERVFKREEARARGELQIHNGA